VHTYNASTIHSTTGEPARSSKAFVGPVHVYPAWDTGTKVVINLRFESASRTSMLSVLVSPNFNQISPFYQAIGLEKPLELL
ncbi:hypothetical protein WG66_012396, partial [Moniliophthora roreri]